MGAGSSNSLQDQLANYTAPMPDIARQYQQNITKGGFLDMPSFNEMFNSYRALGEREAARQTANATQAFGSQGARYSSDLLNAGGQIRENLMQNLLSQASQYQLGLRQQQSNEVGALANLQFGSNEAAMNRYFQDFLRRTSPPPVYQTAVSQSQGYGLPPAIV